MQDTVGIYYINLASRPDRRAFMEAQFEKLGLVAERVEAVTPDDLTEAQFKENCLPHRPLGRAPGEVACSLSHIKAWKRFLTSGHSACVVLEDDALLSSQLPEVLNAMSERRWGIEMMRLETVGAPLRLSKPISEFGQNFEVRRLYSGCTHTTGYALGVEAAHAMLQPIDYLHIPIDIVTFNPYGHARRRVEFSQITPAVVVSLAFLRHPEISVDRYLVETWAEAGEAQSDLLAERDWREGTEWSARSLTNHLKVAFLNIKGELIAGPSKFMQDYFWKIKKYKVPFCS
ncbi:glycosyltransferase family 25 protein [Arsenicitalea aurantiaca]|uniref:Glycosyltransferase family 25 protein n=1 Tax=Arsenicitalea aurantiaca TaxID=1783274 RepID=A0A433XLY7_9HYPH|nr:glycosyltransferase family 25 protein [Arsenicitalea aurantiaca]RUT35024.1 glycosyltransferase family 25 protein [Arsenicitalea aurantiaca]